MTGETFKANWPTDSLTRWYEFDFAEIDKSPLKEETKLFMKSGFPEGAAPFLGFGWRSYDDKFYNVRDLYAKYGYDLEIETKDYWVLGSDGGGNPICIDVANDDRILLLDHEIEFDIIEQLNSNIMELASCLLEYKKFIKKVHKEVGHDPYTESQATIDLLNELRNTFLNINPRLFDSQFWSSSVEGFFE